MSPELAEYMPMIIGGIIGALVAIFVVMRLNRRARVIRDENAPKDVLDEGAAPAARNQAFIDAPQSVANNFGETSANANADQIAGAEADAEAGAVVSPSKPAPAEATGGDDLTRIKGLGPKLATMLKEQGITSYAQIAAWSDADVERVDASLGRFAGRIMRDQWVAQAKLLAAGDEGGFVDKFGQNG